MEAVEGMQRSLMRFMVCDELGVHKETLNLWLLESDWEELKSGMLSSAQIKLIVISPSSLYFQADLLLPLHFSRTHKNLVLKSTRAPYILT